MLQGAMMQRIVRAIQDQIIMDRVADVVQPPAKRAFQRAADISSLTGLLGALASAFTGLADWSDTTGRARIGLCCSHRNLHRTNWCWKARRQTRSRASTRASLTA